MADAKNWYAKKLGNQQPAQQPPIPNQWAQALQQPRPNLPQQQQPMQEARGDGTTAGTREMVMQGDRNGGQRTRDLQQRVAQMVCPSCGANDYTGIGSAAPRCFECGYSARLGSSNVAE